MESVLTSVKKMIGITEEDESFDLDLLIHINSVFGILTQIGAGPVKGFVIKDKSAKWTDFIPEGSKLEFVKSYVELKTKLIFDPPQSSTTKDAMEKCIAELEWRISVAVDPGETIQGA